MNICPHLQKKKKQKTKKHVKKSCQKFSWNLVCTCVTVSLCLCACQCGCVCVLMLLWCSCGCPSLLCPPLSYEKLHLRLSSLSGPALRALPWTGAPWSYLSCSLNCQPQCCDPMTFFWNNRGGKLIVLHPSCSGPVIQPIREPTDGESLPASHTIALIKEKKITFLLLWHQSLKMTTRRFVKTHTAKTHTFVSQQDLGQSTAIFFSRTDNSSGKGCQWQQ